jgi:hypothetical protein
MGFIDYSDRKDQILDEIVRDLSLGVPFREICRRPGMPTRTAIWQWEQQDPELRRRIAEAKLLGADSIAEQALAIADNVEEDPASRKVRVWTRLQLLAKWFPKQYGEKIIQEHSGHLSQQILVVSGVPRLASPVIDGELASGPQIEVQDLLGEPAPGDEDDDDLW